MLIIAGILALAMLMMVVTLAYYRWHPILALLACALMAASMTPGSSLLMSNLREKGWQVVKFDADQLQLRASSRTPTPGPYFLAPTRNGIPAFTQVGGASVVRVDVQAINVAASGGGWVVNFAPLSSSDQQMLLPFAEPSGFWLLEESQWKAVSQASRSKAIERISKGFGGTCEKIGIVILLASIIGACLISSGAAKLIVVRLSELFGQSRVTFALVVAGFVLGIPVYFDTVFLLLLPVAIAYYRTTGKSYLFVIMSVVVGATMAHSLVPPTPGPLLVANALKINIGTAMIMGMVVGLVTATSGWLFSYWLAQRWPIAPVHDDVKLSISEISSGSSTAVSPLSFSLAIAPILLPMILLAGEAFVSAMGDALPLPRSATLAIEWFGQKEIALAIAAFLAIYAVLKSGKTSEELTRVMQDGLTVGGTVLLVTSAGGAFGDTIRQTDIAGILADQSMVPQNGIGLLCIAFLITALVRVLQGSATVAMFTAIGLIQPWVDPSTLGYHPVYLALAIGCGSKMCPWMNDSGFWLVGRMAGLTPMQTLRSFSLVLSMMGLVGLGVILILAKLLPLA